MVSPKLFYKLPHLKNSKILTEAVNVWADLTPLTMTHHLYSTRPLCSEPVTLAAGLVGTMFDHYQGASARWLLRKWWEVFTSKTPRIAAAMMVINRFGLAEAFMH